MIIDILKIITLVILVTLCMYTDIKERKIKNKYLLISFLAGLTLSLISGGLSGLKDSLIGTIIPFVIFFIFFALNLFGSGDIKLFCVIGSIMGSHFIINNIFYSFICSFILILLYLLIKNRLFEYIKYMFFQIKSLIITKSTIENVSGEKTKFPFAGAIFIGTLLQLILKYNFI